MYVMTEFQFDDNPQNGGRIIKPSARKSIHSHTRRISITKREEMVRYAEDSSEDERPGSSAWGTDEVDNVPSKMSHTSSPLSMRKPRRNSMTPPNQHYTDTYTVPDLNSNMLAKSLPATLPSHSNCSDEFETLQAQSPTISNHLNRTRDSVTTPRSTSRSIDSRNSSFSTRSPNVSRLNQSNHRNEESKSSGGMYLILFALLGIVAAAYYYELVFKSTLKSNHIYDELRFHSDLNELGAKYKVGDNSILQLQTGISTIYKREDTSCLIFVYNSLSDDFDPIKFDGFVNNVASKAAKFLRNDTASVQYLVVEGSDLKMQSHSQLVKAYREDVAKTGVLLIRDVEHVPSPLAMAFHYYCDEYNPLVKKSAIFFTLNSAKCHNAGEKSSHATVEKCLKEKWSTVPKDNIGPLLTRVVSIVVDVTSGF